MYVRSAGMYAPAGNTGTMAATGTTPYNATLVHPHLLTVPSDFTGTIMAGSQHYSAGTTAAVEGPVLLRLVYMYALGAAG